MGGGWGVGWGGIITSLALSHIRDATLLYVLLDFHAYVMLRYVLLDFHACVIFCSEWSGRCVHSYLHDDQEDERADFDDGDGHDDGDDGDDDEVDDEGWRIVKTNALGALKKTRKWRFRVGEMTVFPLLGTKVLTAFTLKSHEFLLARAHQTWSTTSHEYTIFQRGLRLIIMGFDDKNMGKPCWQAINQKWWKT